MRVVRDGKEPYVEQVKYDAQHTTQLECMCALATSKAFLEKKTITTGKKTGMFEFHLVFKSHILENHEIVRYVWLCWRA